MPQAAKGLPVAGASMTKEKKFQQHWHQVNSFDEKLSQCFRDYQEQVEKIAPVQVRIWRQDIHLNDFQ